MKTGSVDGAGTDADVEIMINGQATSGWYVLDNNGDDRENSQLDTYGFSTPSHLGNISSIVLRVKKADEDRPDWFLDYVEIIDNNNPQGVVTYYFPYSNWIRPNSYTQWVDATIYPTNTTTISGTSSPQSWSVCVISNATGSRYTTTAVGYSAQDAASNLKAELFFQNTGGVGFDVIPGACP